MEFCERIYDEYFDHRMYLIEQYLDCVGKIIDTISIKNVFQYMVKFMEKFTELMNMEKTYYEK